MRVWLGSGERGRCWWGMHQHGRCGNLVGEIMSFIFYFALEDPYKIWWMPLEALFAGINTYFLLD